MSKYLFVYGTLRPALAPPEMIGAVHQLRPVGPAKLRGRLYDLGQYPGAIPDAASDTFISGEVFELPEDPNVLASLDAYEGFDPARPRESLFVRTETLVTLSDGRGLTCWIYLYNRIPTAAPLIAGGDYAEARAAKRGS